jgi:kynurenine formamidase
MGVDTVGTIFTRGVLVDIAGLKGVPVLGDDLRDHGRRHRAGVAAPELAHREGDAVLFHTGWGTLWGRDNPRYVRSCPGLGVAAAEWVIQRNPI